MTIDLTIVVPTGAFGIALGYMVKMLREDKRTIRGFNGDKAEIKQELREVVDNDIRHDNELNEFRKRLVLVESKLRVFKRE